VYIVSVLQLFFFNQWYVEHKKQAFLICDRYQLQNYFRNKN
jgi:hypothetical protein